MKSVMVVQHTTVYFHTSDRVIVCIIALFSCVYIAYPICIISVYIL